MASSGIIEWSSLSRVSFGLESAVSGTTHIKPLQQTKSPGHQLELHELWLPSPELAIRRIVQRVKMGGHAIPESGVRRRFNRRRTNFTSNHAPLADL